MEGLKLAAELMAISARTAPKSYGKDFVQIKILQGESVHGLAEAMVRFGGETGKENFNRDGENVGNSPVVLLVGIKEAKPVGLDCGGCGFSSCKELLKASPAEGEFRGFQCALRLLDLGIALGSAVKTASLLNVDNRIMYRVGAVARRMGFCDWDLAMGIPLSATGKSIYFDR
jgi:uncharacterized ferredoxin-like protein